MNYSVAVALKLRARRAKLLENLSSFGIFRLHRIRRQKLFFDKVRFILHTICPLTVLYILYSLILAFSFNKITKKTLSRFAKAF